ncbi:MAG: ferritin-like domain-containing protein [Nannocystaceae bacterium]
MVDVLQEFRRALWFAAAGSLACGPTVVAPGGDAGADGSSSSGLGTDTAASHSSSADASATTATATSAAGTDSLDGGSTDAPIKFDLGAPDSGVPPECVPTVTPREPCEVPPPPDAIDVRLLCVSPAVECATWAAAFDPGNLDPAAQAVVPCIDGGDGSCGGGTLGPILCGPYEGDDTCCFWFAIEDTQICPGRPFTIAGTARRATARANAAWLAAEPSVTVGSRDADAIAAAWTEAALFEHASVASFARAVLHLLAVAAPAELVAATQRSLSEEIGHARSLFSLASRWAGHAVGPGPLDVDGALADVATLAQLVIATVEEGCIAETVSAWQLYVAAERAADPEVRTMLHRIAREEVEHAALAWRVLAWALPQVELETRCAIQQRFAEPHRYIARGPRLASGVSDETWRGAGLLPACEREAAARNAIHALVLPTAAMVLTGAAPAFADDAASATVTA